MLDFERIKQIPIGDVCMRYGIALKFKGDWGKSRCPLPTHDKADKDSNFGVNTKENYWHCFSKSCNKAAGKAGGDVISFVTIREGLTDKDADKAAKMLAEWFHIPNKEAAHIERPASPGRKAPAEGHQKHNSPSVDGKGYIRELNVWFDEMVKRGDQEDETAYLERLRKGFINRVIESFRNGQKKAQGLPMTS